MIGQSLVPRRLTTAATGLLLLLCGAAPLTRSSSVDDVLDAMQARGQDLKSFTADVKQTEDSMGGETVRRGSAALQILPGGDARLLYTIKTKQKGTRPPVPYRREYLLDKGWLTDRDESLRTDTHRQVVAPGNKLDLFQLGKGPFPLPIGQDRAKVLQQFTVTKVPPAADDPPGSIHLQLVPKTGGQFARDYATIDFWVDPAQRMPVRVETVKPRGGLDTTTDLTNLKVNAAVGDADFTLPAMPGRPVVDVPLGS